MNIKLFTPHVAQKRVVDGFADSEHKFGVFVSSRQSGKSVLGMNLMLYWLLSNSDQIGAWITPVFAQSRKVHEELSDKARDVIVSSNKAEYSITFVNGSKLRFLSGDSPDSIRGYSFHYVIIDEAAYVKEQAISQAILPTLNAVGKKCLMISTPKGKNHFYQWYLKGTESNNMYISFKARTDENPYADLLFIEEQRKSLPESIFRAEYEGEFTDASSDVFRELDKVCVLREFSNGNKTEKCFAGIDTGLSDDYSALCIISESGRVLHMEKRNGENITSISTHFISTLSRYNITGGFIETNGIGRAMFDLVKPRFRKIKPFTTTQDSKTAMVRQLIGDMENMNVELPHEDLFPDLIKEMSAYTYKLSTNGKISFTHPAGQKDDLVDALLMANHARNTIQTRGLYIGGPPQQNDNVYVSFGGS